jgi:glucose-1-phosphate cytidylyltransferase
MKVVLFCGGQGLRLRDYAETLPKPMVPIGPRPVLWHVMRYYAHFGYRDFVLCLGYKADAIKEYFLRYNEALSNDFILSDGGRSLELLGTDIQDWKITFVDTGLQASIGERLRAVRQHLVDEDVFLANYADVLTDARIDLLVEDFRGRNKVAGFLSVRPKYTFHLVQSAPDGHVSGIRHVHEADLWINGGHFILRPSVFDYMEPGDELVEATFDRLIAADQLITYRHDGFWAPMDTLKEMQLLEALYDAGQPPWMLWRAPELDARP